MRLKYNKFILIFFLFFVFAISKAQVSINTQNALGIFHIDVKGDNPPSGAPSALQISDDIVIDKNSSAGLNMSVGGKVNTNSSAQLALLDPNKAILINRVALTDLRDIVTIPNPPEGTLVYNTATSGVFPDNISPGYYYFNGIVWYQLQSGTLDSELTQLDLLTNCVSSQISGLNASPALATLLNFSTIEIKQTGTYIFSLRLFGTATTNSTGGTSPKFARSVNYLFLMKNGTTKLASMEINVAQPLGGLVAYTHTATLQVTVNKGDIITFRLGHYNYGWQLEARPGNNANRTSLIYWKI